MKKQVFNPYLPSTEYVPDVEPRIFNDRLYIFGSHDRFGGDDYCMNDYVGWSAPLNDLSNWRCSGIIFRKDQQPYTGNLYAPDCVQGLDGKYYLYFSPANSSVIGVAVCDEPDGKYEYLGDVHYENGEALGTRDGDYFQFDPAVLIDDTKIFLYSGSGQTSIQDQVKQKIAGLTVTELEEDMLTVKSRPKVIMNANETWKAPNFFEAASIRKINKLYYLIFSATNATGLNYCISKYPDKEFHYQGPIHSTSDIGYHKRNFLQANYPVGSSHGGIVEIKGQWYIFDQRVTNHTYFTRQGVAEPIMFSPDGLIEQAEATSCGLNNGPLIGLGEYPAYIACNLIGGKNVFGPRDPAKMPYITQDGEDRNDGPDQYVANIHNNDVIGFKYFRFDQQIKEISITTRGDGDGKLVISLDRQGKSKIGIINVGSSAQWKNHVGTINHLTGVQSIYFKFKGQGTLALRDFNFIPVVDQEVLS
ncbi:MAG: family 43 glycosylhydrolase [Liquorilactobacillus ghanensis]|uniref:family 43 glycosylhydrolase n=1 Tax=Liquorilactobacillus ghanensis TaxID=399370 RepID=UPI0039E79409